MNATDIAVEKLAFFVGQQTPMDEAVQSVLTDCGIRTRTFRSAEDCCQSLGKGHCELLLIDLDGDPSCGLNLLIELQQMFWLTPKIVFVNHGDIATAVQATKAGAIACLDKPIDTKQLCSEIEAILDEGGSQARHLLSRLTSMEKTVLQYVLAGQTNHQTAQALHRSARTIEIHRKNLMRKMDVANVIELVTACASMGLLDQAGTLECPRRLANGCTFLAFG